MHTSLRYDVEPGQSYFLAFPGFFGDVWHPGEILVPDEELYWDGGENYHGRKVPLGSRALVLSRPGEDAKQVAYRFSQDRSLFVWCLVTPLDEHCFCGWVMISSLWHEDPRVDKCPTAHEQGIIKALFDQTYGKRIFESRDPSEIRGLFSS